MCNDSDFLQTANQTWFAIQLHEFLLRLMDFLHSTNSGTLLVDAILTRVLSLTLWIMSYVFVYIYCFRKRKSKKPSKPSKAFSSNPKTIM